MSSWVFFNLLLLLLTSNVVSLESQYSSLNNASLVILFYQTSPPSVKLAQFDVQDERSNLKQRIYFTRTRELLTLSPEARFYTFGTIYSSFRFLDLNITSNDSGESICDPIISNHQKISWFFDQLYLSYSIFNSNYQHSEDISVCIITLSKLKARNKVSNFYPKNSVVCGSVLKGNHLVIDQFSTLIETKELVQATCILFLTLILIGWLQSSCQQFVNDRRRLPFQQTFVANDISIGTEEIWNHATAKRASFLVAIYYMFVGVTWHTIGKWTRFRQKGELNKRHATRTVNQVLENSSPSSFIFLTGFSKACIIALIFCVAFIRCLVPQEWPRSGYNSFNSLDSFLSNWSESHNTSFNFRYVIIWCLCVIMFLVSQIIQMSYHPALYIEYLIAKPQHSPNTQRVYMVLNGLFGLMVLTIYYIFILVLTQWAPVTKAVFLILSSAFYIFSLTMGLTVPIGSIEEIKSGIREFYLRLLCVYIVEYIYLISFSILAFFMADVVFAFVWYNINNVIIYQNRVAWISFVGLLVMTIKSLIEEITVPFRLTREILIDKCPSLFPPKMSQLSGRKLKNILDFFSKHKFYSHLLEWVHTQETEKYEKILAILKDQTSDLTMSYLDLTTAVHKDEIDDPKLQVSFRRAETFTCRKEFMSDDFKSGIELNEKEVMLICESIANRDNQDEQEPGLLHNLQKLEVYSPLMRETVRNIPLEPLFERNGQIYFPISYELFLQIHDSIMGRTNLLTEFFSKHLFIAVASSILFLAFSALNESTNSQYEFFGNILAVATVFLPAIFSSIDKEKLKESIQNRISNAIQLKKKDLVGHVPSLDIDYFNFAVLHVHPCSSVGMFMQQRQVTSAPWLFSKPLSHSRMVELEDLWTQHQTIFGFVHLQTTHDNFFQQILQIIAQDFNPTYKIESYEQIQFWKGVFDDDKDYLFTYRELLGVIEKLKEPWNQRDPRMTIVEFMFRYFVEDDEKVPFRKIRSAKITPSLVFKNMLPAIMTLNVMEKLMELDNSFQRMQAICCDDSLRIDVCTFTLLLIGLKDVGEWVKPDIENHTDLTAWMPSFLHVGNRVLSQETTSPQPNQLVIEEEL